MGLFDGREYVICRLPKREVAGFQWAFEVQFGRRCGVYEASGTGEVQILGWSRWPKKAQREMAVFSAAWRYCSGCVGKVGAYEKVKAASAGVSPDGGSGRAIEKASPGGWRDAVCVHGKHNSDLRASS